MSLDIDIYRQRIGKFLIKGIKFSSNNIQNQQLSFPSSSSSFLLFAGFIILPLVVYSIVGAAILLQSSSILFRFPSRMISNSEAYGFWVDNNFLARYKYGNKNKEGIKIMHWNCGGGYLKNKINEIETVISKYKPHILGISESYFMKGHDLDDVYISDYNIYLSKTLENPELNVSRLAVFVHKNVPKVKLRLDLMDRNFSSVWLEVGLKYQKSILVGNVYRDWQFLGQNDHSSLAVTAQYERFSRFIDKWETALDSSDECHLVGDLNLNFLEYTKPQIPTGSQSYKLRSLINLLYDRILPLGAVQCVTGATWVSNVYEHSGLDHYFTNNPEKLSVVQTIYNGASDHKILLATRYSKCKVDQERIVKKRSYKHFDPEQFRYAVKGINFWEIYSCNDVNEAVRLLSESMIKILDEMAPVKVFQKRTKYAPWLTLKTKQLLRLRNEAHQKALESKTDVDWANYKKQRNYVNNVLKYDKEVWKFKKLKEASNDSSKTWNTIKGILGWTTGGPPTKLFMNGMMLNKPFDIAQEMNNFFVDKVKKIVNNLPSSDQNAVDLTRSLMRDRKCNFNLQAVHPDTVSKIIGNLKSSHSCGLDTIDAYVIKLVRAELVPVLTHIINLSIRENIFPTTWKNAKIIPLHKKDEQTNPKNYRPVALLSIFSKILERAIFQQVVEYMEVNMLFHPSHHGFRHGHSTATALIEMQDIWMEAFDRNEITATVMLDLSAAFDVVNKNILLGKLEAYGFKENVLLWFSSYLTSRFQQVYIDGSLSEPLMIDIGVPQGSILGPLLYVIYTNDLPEVIHDQSPHSQANKCGFYNLPCNKCGSICSFADDSTYSISRLCPIELKEVISCIYESISKYMAMNRLALNADKTHFMVLTSSAMHKKNQDFGITLNTGSELIQPTQNERLLGAYVSNDFTWNEHVYRSEKSMIKMINLKINALRKISNNLDFKTRKLIANGIINSRFIYIVQLYGSAQDYVLNMLQVQQNRAARIVTRQSLDTSTKEVLRQIGWLSIRQLYVYHSLLTTFKTLCSGKPSYMSKKFTRSFPYQTRQATGGCLKVSETPKSYSSGKSFMFSSIKYWNLLPTELRKEKDLRKFKTGLRKWTTEVIPIH